MEVAQLTQVGIVPPAELPAATEAQVEGLLVRAPQLVSALDGSKGFLSIAVGDKAIVIPDIGGDQQQQLCLSTPLVCNVLMNNRKRAKKNHPWEGTDPSSHSSYPSERKCKVHSSMSPNTEKRCRSSDRVILLGILPINTTRRSSCGQGCPIHEQDPLHRAPSLQGLPPHYALARASQQCCWQGCTPMAF